MIIGCGNPLRGDDGVGLVVARALRSRLPPGVNVVEHRVDGATLLDAWRGAQTVILVDAAESGGDPGTVVRFDAAAGPLPVRLRATSSHAFGAGEAIELARALGELPPYFAVYAIVGLRHDPGMGLSAEVRTAARRVMADILSRTETQLCATMNSLRPDS